MRSGSLTAVVIVAAVLGGAAVLLGAKAGGLLGSGTTTVVVDAQSAVGDANAPVVAAKPLLGNGFQPAQIYRARAAGVVTVYAAFGSGADGGQGSGFVVSPAGSILTNAHVVTNAGEAGVLHPARARAVYVQFSDGDRVPATIVGADLFDDVAVLHVDPHLHALSPVPLGDSARVVVGQPVAAIGSPFGDTGSLSVGVVSAIRRSIPSLTTAYDLVDAIQTDAPINHGNSGGPLFDARGRVIGITAQISSSGGAGSGSEGVGFAVPIDAARRSLQQLLAAGTVSYAYVGIDTEDLTPSIAQHFGYAARYGALISRVVPGSGAARAGLRPATRTAAFEGLAVPVGGDAIVAIAGEPVRTAADVVRIVASRFAPGQTARFTVVNGSRRRTVAVKLGARTVG